MRSIQDFVQEHWGRWSAKHDYLGFPRHWDPRCPPLWFIGGNRDPTTPPLVIISLEPLRTRHFDDERYFASRSEKNYHKWQLDFFAEFPRLTEQENRPQRYWSTLHAFVAGYAGVKNDFQWSNYARNCIELPLVPLHSDRHRSTGRFRDVVRGYLIERMRIIAQTWPRTAFVTLGRGPTERLTEGNDTTSCCQLDLRGESGELHEELGDRFLEPVEVRRFTTSDLKTCLLFCRRSPFAQGWSPKVDGRYKLGELIRKKRDSILSEQ